MRSSSPCQTVHAITRCIEKNTETRHQKHSDHHLDWRFGSSCLVSFGCYFHPGTGSDIWWRDGGQSYSVLDENGLNYRYALKYGCLNLDGLQLKHFYCTFQCRHIAFFNQAPTFHLRRFISCFQSWWQQSTFQVPLYESVLSLVDVKSSQRHGFVANGSKLCKTQTCASSTIDVSRAVSPPLCLISISHITCSCRMASCKRRKL